MRTESLNGVARSAFLAVLATVLLCAPAFLSCAAPQSQSKAPAASQSAHKGFATPRDAADALIQAAETYDVPALLEILGPEGEPLVTSEDPVRDKSNSHAFAARAHEKQSVAVDKANPNRAWFSVGNEDWPLPIPLVKKAGKWYFDSKAGREEILYRRIGANELDAIAICRGFVEAQKEYALQVHDDSGVNQYAQRIISTPGKQDGLYWQNADGTPGGPISEFVAKAIEEGYSVDKRSAFHGYYFHVLKGQGPAAPLGELDYVIKGVMIGGFALIVVPAEYRVTGVQTFMVSQDGIVYQKDLGPDSLNIAKKIERYNPDKSWHITSDDW
ncbi:MAG: DUF2950 domain-containing protein [Acidobacteriia bacterium]|nr:DUF2950 domain-containing protein [Terriglobia bacterium]